MFFVQQMNNAGNAKGVSRNQPQKIMNNSKRTRILSDNEQQALIKGSVGHPALQHKKESEQVEKI